MTLIFLIRARQRSSASNMKKCVSSSTMEEFSEEVGAIKKAYPELAIKSVEPNLDGQYNTVLVVNGDTIFRFPRFASGIEQLALETEILTVVQPHITLQIPNPIYHRFEPPIVGQTFMGYKMIAGDGLWPKVFNGLDTAVKANIAKQLATFLRELHHVPIADLIDTPLPISDGVDEWEDIYGRIEEKLFPYMRLDAARSVASHFENYFVSGMTYQPCLRHGDFGTGNILFDAAKQQINGIIDFGFTVLGDPATDFAGLLTYGQDFVESMTPYYPKLAEYWERIWFYKGTFALFDALYGIENDVPEVFEAGMVDYV